MHQQKICAVLPETRLTARFVVLGNWSREARKSGSVGEPTSHFSLTTSPDPLLTVPLILVVDDDDAVRSSTSRLLARAEHSVIEARSVREAQDIWSARSGEIALLLTDQALGDGAGAELLAAFRRDRPDLPVVLYSGQDGGSLRDGTELPHDVHLLAKPFTRDGLLATIRAALAGTSPSHD